MRSPPCRAEFASAPRAPLGNPQAVAEAWRKDHAAFFAAVIIRQDDYRLTMSVAERATDPMDLGRLAGEAYNEEMDEVGLVLGGHAVSMEMRRA